MVVGVGILRNRVCGGRRGCLCSGRAERVEQGKNWMSVLYSCSLRWAGVDALVGLRVVSYAVGVEWCGYLCRRRVAWSG